MTRRATPARAHQTTRRFRPSLEALEDRNLLSAGGLDPAFGDEGIALTDFPGALDVVGILPFPDGSQIAVVSNISRDDGNYHIGLAKYKQDGRIDASFHALGFHVVPNPTDLEITPVAATLDADGTFLVLSNDDNGGALIERFNADGSLVDGFGKHGIAPVPRELLDGKGIQGLVNIEVQGDSIIVVGINFGSVHLLRLDGDGNLDMSFGTDGVASTDNSFWLVTNPQLAIQSTGRIVVAVSVYEGILGAPTDVGLVGFTPRGAIDTDFGDQGYARIGRADRGEEVAAVTLDANDSIVVVGSKFINSSHPSGLYQVLAARFLSNGALDPRFGDGSGTGDAGTFLLANDQRREIPIDVALDARGNILIASLGYDFDPSQGFSMGVLRLMPAGVLDTGFRTNGETVVKPTVPNETVSVAPVDLALDRDGNVVIIGSANYYNAGIIKFAVARVDNQPDPSAIGLRLTSGTAYTRPNSRLSFTATVVRDRGGALPTGQVLFYDRSPGGEDRRLATVDVDANGQATADLGPNPQTALPQGEHTIFAVYQGSGDAAADASTSVGIPVKIDPAAPLAADPNHFNGLEISSARPEGGNSSFSSLVSGSVVVQSGDIATFIITSSVPSTPPKVTLRLGLTSSGGTVQTIPLPNTNQPELSQQFVYTLRLGGFLPLGLADVIVQGEDINGSPVQPMTKQFTVVRSRDDSSPGHFPIDLSFAASGAVVLQPGNTGIIVAGGSTNPGLVTIRPFAAEAAANHRVLIYPVNRLPPNLILVDRTGKATLSATGTVAGSGAVQLTAKFRPAASQAGQVYPVTFGCLDLETGVSTLAHYTFQVDLNDRPQRNVTLTPSSLVATTPSDAGSFAFRQVTFTIHADNLLQTSRPVILRRFQDDAEFTPVSAVNSDFRPSGTDYLYTGSFFSQDRKGLYEYKAIVHSPDGDYESNHVSVYFGGRAESGNVEQLRTPNPSLPAVMIPLAPNEALYPHPGTEVTLFDDTGTAFTGVVSRGAGNVLQVFKRDPLSGELTPIVSRGAGVIAVVAGAIFELNANGIIRGAGAAAGLPSNVNFNIVGTTGQIIAAGAGNTIIAAGAGNTLVAPGAGGSIIAAGAGNTFLPESAVTQVIAVEAALNLADRRGVGSLAAGAGSGLVAPGAGGTRTATGEPASFISLNATALRDTLAGVPRLRSLKAPAVVGPTPPAVATTPGAAALDAELYAYFQLWHAELLKADGNAATDAAFTQRVSAAADALEAAALLRDVGFDALSPAQLTALSRASTIMRLDVAPATPGGIIAPGSTVILTAHNPADSLATGSATAAAGTVPVALAGSVVTFGGEYGAAAQPDMAPLPIQLYGQGLALRSVAPNQVVAHLPLVAPVGSPQLVLLTTADGRLALGQIVLQPSTGDLEFSASTYTVGQADGAATITINRTGGSEGVIVYQFAASDGTAVDGVDYTSQGGFVIFADGDTTPKTVTVPVVNRGVGAPDTTVQLTLFGATNIDTPQPTKTALLTLEAANPGLTVTPLETPATAVGGGSFSFTVRLESPPSADVTIPLSTSNPSAASVSVSALTFTPSNWQTPQTVVVSGGATAGDYTVNVGAATSADADYDGRSAALPATNLPSLVKGVGTFTDSDGDRYTVKLKGPGRVSVLQNDAGDTLFVSGTTAKSKLSISVTRGTSGDGLVQVGRIQVLSALGKFKAPGVDLAGANVNVNGSLGAVTLHAVRAGSTIAVGGNVTSFTATVFADSFLYVGFTPTNPSEPLTGTFAAGNFKLGSFKVSGLVAPAFVNSVVAAANVGTVTLTSALTDNAPHDHRAFGVVGHAIKKVRIGKPAFAFDRNHPATELDDFEVRIV